MMRLLTVFMVSCWTAVFVTTMFTWRFVFPALPDPLCTRRVSQMVCARPLLPRRLPMATKASSSTVLLSCFSSHSCPTQAPEPASVHPLERTPRRPYPHCLLLRALYFLSCDMSAALAKQWKQQTAEDEVHRTEPQDLEKFLQAMCHTHS